MKKSNHIWFAFILCLIFVYILSLFKLNFFNFSMTSIFIMACIILFYCLLPDIDHKNSTITWWFFGLGVLGLLVGMIGVYFNFGFFDGWALMIVSTFLLVFTYVSVILFKHRGIVHSIPVGLLSIVPLFFVFHSFSYCALAYVAWHSHLIGDGYLIKIK